MPPDWATALRCEIEVLEAELAHDEFDPRILDHDWWDERRPLYVRLHRLAALSAAAAPVMSLVHTGTYVTVPAPRVEELPNIEAEVRELLQRPPHRRWCDMEVYDMILRWDAAGQPWPPGPICALLAAADRVLHAHLYREQSLRLAIGARVEALMGPGDQWRPATVVWRAYRETSQYGDLHPYQLLLDTGELVFSPADHDSVVRAPRGDDAAQLPPDAERRPDLLQTMLEVLSVAWWQMPGGYERWDIVPPGCVGAVGLTAPELEAGLRANQFGDVLCPGAAADLEEALEAIRCREISAVDAVSTATGAAAGGEPTEAEMMMMAAAVLEEDRQRPQPHRSDPFYHLMTLLLGDQVIEPVAAASACAACAQRAKPSAGAADTEAVVRLLRCGRCHTVAYCSAGCQKSHWKAHKPHCVPVEALVDRVLAGLQDTARRLAEDTPPPSEEAVTLALKLTWGGIEAAVALITLLTHTHTIVKLSPEGGDPRAFAKSLELVFGLGKAPSRKTLRQLEIALGCHERIEQARAESAAEHDETVRRMQPVHALCARILKLMLRVLAGVKLCRVNPHDSAARGLGYTPPHKTNRDLVQCLYRETVEVTGKVRSASKLPHHNIPAFLALADEVVAGCPDVFEGDVVAPHREALRALVWEAWVRYKRVHERLDTPEERAESANKPDPYDPTDAELVKLGQQSQFIRNSSYNRGDGIYPATAEDAVGWWLPAELVRRSGAPIREYNGDRLIRKRRGRRRQ